MSLPFQDNGESSSSRQPQPPPSQFSGLGLGLGLSDSFSQASVSEEPASSPSFTTDPSQPESGLTPAELTENARRVAAAAAARESITQSDLSAIGIELSSDAFAEEDALPSLSKSPSPPKRKPKAKAAKNHHNFFSNMANAPELFMELAKHLRIPDLLSLYAISKDFHETINGHLSHCMRACGSYMAPESSTLYLFKFYSKLCVPDPAGRRHPKYRSQTRLVPGLKWLQMVVHRDKVVRDILACLARQGHRMKPGIGLSLKKMWLVMDIATTAGRVQMMHNERLFTDFDLYNLQFFIVKLDMRFNDPVDGPGNEDLRKLFLGQRSLTSLCLLLKRKAFLDTISVIRLAVRYSYAIRPEHRYLPIFGIPPEEIAIGHLEGWGKGKVHLMRPDELVMRESVRRQLGLKNYIMEMMTWGYIDPMTGKNIEVTDEEMWMSDDGIGKKNNIGKNGEVWSDYWDFEGSADEDSGEEDAEHDEDSDEIDDDDDNDEDDENEFSGNGVA